MGSIVVGHMTREKLNNFGVYRNGGVGFVTKASMGDHAYIHGYSPHGLVNCLVNKDIFHDI